MKLKDVKVDEGIRDRLRKLDPPWSLARRMAVLWQEKGILCVPPDGHRRNITPGPAAFVGETYNAAKTSWSDAGAQEGRPRKGVTLLVSVSRKTRHTLEVLRLTGKDGFKEPLGAHTEE